MRIDLFQPTDEGEARILLLVEAFSRGMRILEGRLKLAKLDFFLRYPGYLKRALVVRGVPESGIPEVGGAPDLETRMVRYRYGPWDPSYYAILGRLIGKRLVLPVPGRRGIGYKISDKGREIGQGLAQEPAWEEVVKRIELIRRHLNLQGHTLKDLIYQHFPEVSRAAWGEPL